MKRTCPPFLPALALAAVSTATAFAQDASPRSESSALEEATEILVTATRHESPSFAVPRSTSVVGSNEIQLERSRRTVPDALLDLPSVMVQRTAYGQASPFIRGFTGFRNVMLVDGIRLNNSVFRSGPNQYWSTIDTFSVDRVEVVRGISSVLYGSDAIGGAVNAVARRRSTFEPGLHAEGRVVGRWADAEDSYVGRIESQGNQDDLGWFAGATYRTYGDLEAGSGTRDQPGTGYRDTDGDLRVDWRAREGVTWTFGVQHVDQDNVPRTHKTVDAVSFEGTEVGTELRRDLDQTRDLLYGRVHLDRVDWGFADEFEATVSWHRQEESRHRDRDRGRTDVQGFEVDTLGLQLQAHKDTDAGFFTYGVEWWHDDVDSFRRDYQDGALSLERIQGPVADDATYDLVGVYAQDEITWGATTVTAGVRFTYAAADANDVDNPEVGGSDPDTPGNVISIDDSWTNVVGSVRAVHPLAPGVNAFGGVSQGFRAPNLSDLTRLDATSGVETPNPDLDAEDFIGAEIGVKVERSQWTAQLTYWRTWLEDTIVQSPTGRTIDGTQEVRKDNVGDGWINGVEAELAYRPAPAWTFSTQGSWMDGEVDQIASDGRKVRRPVSRLMPLTGSFEAHYREPGELWHLWTSLRLVDDADELALRDENDTERIPPGGTPGYELWNVGAGFEITDRARLSVVLENVTNENYRIHGSGINEPGRNLVLTLDVVF